MIQVVRSVVFYAGYFAALLVIGALFLPIAPFLPLAGRYRLLNLYNYFLMFWFRIACGVRYDIQGAHHLPEGPCVIQANHQSEWETVFLQVMKPPVCTVLKQELLLIPVFGWGLRLLRPISLDRSKPARAMKQVLTQGVARLGTGLSVLIFLKAHGSSQASASATTRAAAWWHAALGCRCCRWLTMPASGGRVATGSSVQACCACASASRSRPPGEPRMKCWPTWKRGSRGNWCTFRTCPGHSSRYFSSRA